MDDDRFACRSVRQTAPPLDRLEDVTGDGATGFDLDGKQRATGFDEQIDLVPRMIPPGEQLAGHPIVPATPAPYGRVYKCAIRMRMGTV